MVKNKDMTTESQNTRIEAHLKEGRSITALEALHKFNCFRLASRINDLRRQGMNIKTDTVEITSDGKQKRFARYKLIK